MHLLGQIFLPLSYVGKHLQNCILQVKNGFVPGAPSISISRSPPTISRFIPVLNFELHINLNHLLPSLPACYHLPALPPSLHHVESTAFITTTNGEAGGAERYLTLRLWMHRSFVTDTLPRVLPENSPECSCL